MEHTNWEGFAKWLNHPNTMAIRFEDLYTDLCSSSNEFGSVLQGIFKFLDIESSDLEPNAFRKSVLNSGRTLSNEKNKIRQFERVYNDDHYRLMKSSRIKAVLKMFDYPE